MLWSPAGDDGMHLLRPVIHHKYAGASRPTPDHGPTAPASVAYRDSPPYPVHQPRSRPYSVFFQYGQPHTVSTTKLNKALTGTAFGVNKEPIKPTVTAMAKAKG